jgi:hypothetical protein
MSRSVTGTRGLDAHNGLDLHLDQLAEVSLPARHIWMFGASHIGTPPYLSRNVCDGWTAIETAGRRE